MSDVEKYIPHRKINELVDKSSEEYGSRVALQIEKNGKWILDLCLSF